MKTLLLLIYSAVLLLTLSCTKDPVLKRPDPFFKVNVFGEEYNFKNVEFYYIKESGSIAAFVHAYDDSLGMEMTIRLNGEGNNLPLGEYKSESEKLHLHFGLQKRDKMIEYNSEELDGMEKPQHVLTLTTNSKIAASGNFAGNVLICHKYGQTLPVTEGSFLVLK